MILLICTHTRRLAFVPSLSGDTLPTRENNDFRLAQTSQQRRENEKKNTNRMNSVVMMTVLICPLHPLYFQEKKENALLCLETWPTLLYDGLCGKVCPRPPPF